MPTVDVTPIVLRDMVLSLDGNDYAAAASSITLTPNTPMVTYKGLKGNVHTFPGTTEWTVVVDFAQDHASAASLTMYLFDNAGQTVPAIIEPQTGEGERWTLNVILTPGAVGGAVDSVASSQVTLGVDGQPAHAPIP